MNDMHMIAPRRQWRLDLRKLSPAIGAEVIGVDLSQVMDDALFRQIERAWHEHCVLLFRRQTLDDLEQVAFAARFGELAYTLKDYEGGKIHPALMYVTNEKKDGKYVGALPDGEMFFHSDMCYLERPLSAATLFALAIPPEGGNTIFASMYAAYDALPENLKQRLEGHFAVNSYAPGYGTSNVQMRIKAPSSPTGHAFAHPVIRTHPATRRKALYVNRLMTEYIVGMPREESDRLLERLFDHQEQPQFQYEHRWEVGDLLIWDNRCTLHARRDFPATHLRKLRRVAVKGERPV
jgi:taurine dioxygenase